MIFQRLARRHPSRLIADRGASLEQARGRLILIAGFFTPAYLLVTGRAVNLSVFHEGYEDNRPQFLRAADPGSMRRADILDRNGALLATTLKTTSLYADPKLIADPKQAAQKLVKIFPDLNYGALLTDLQSKKRFVWVKRRILPEEQRAVLEIGEPGLAFQEEFQRIYPQGPLTAHLVGYTNIDNKGLAGVERALDVYLANADEPLTLSLDVRLQHILRREVLRAQTEFSGIAAFGVIMDAKTGDILAGVSLPDFDPHQAGQADPNAVFNRLSLGVFELGSVFKIFSTAAFLESHDVPLSTTFDARDPIKIGRFTINDYHAENRILTVPEVFMYSSNIGSALMGQAVGTDVLRAFYEDLGLLHPMDFELQEIARPLVPQPWREINTLTAAYGHGLATTPLQMASAVCSIVNDGVIVTPRLVKDARALDPSNKQHEAHIISPETSAKMRQLLRLVVAEGTGSKAEVKGYSVGGKTGTAEKIGSQGGYDRKKLISSFVGVFPADDPQYVIFLGVDEPRGTKQSFGYATAGWVAAPAAARVVTAMASVLGIPPEIEAPDDDISASLRQFVAVKGAH